MRTLVNYLKLITTTWALNSLRRPRLLTEIGSRLALDEGYLVYINRMRRIKLNL